jgi:hypothetical protein
VAGPLLLWLLLALPAVVQAQFTYTTNNNQITITKFTGSGGAVTIPAEINGLPVAVIGIRAFAYSSGVTSITIPDGVTTIGYGAFSECRGVTNITIPGSVTNIEGAAFNECNSLTSVKIPGGVTTIAGATFAGCWSLTSVTIPKGVTSIEGYAFTACFKLASLTIPNSVTRIGGYAFYYCTRLSDVTIPSSVTRIDGYTFGYCQGLTTVVIPESITTLEGQAFLNCTGLKAVYFQGNAPSLGISVFAGANNPTVYYPLETTGWTATFADQLTTVWNPQILPDDSGFGVKSGRFGFNIISPSGRTVVVETCSDLAHPVWSPVGTNTVTSSITYFSDPQWVNYLARFYRLRTP